MIYFVKASGRNMQKSKPDDDDTDMKLKSYCNFKNNKRKTNECKYLRCVALRYFSWYDLKVGMI